MKNLCKHHLATLEAARSDHWESGLRDHVDDCQDCLELLRVHRALDTLARETPSSLRAPDHVWLQYRRRQIIDRAVRPIRIVEYLAATAAVGFGTLSLGPLLWSSLDPLRPVGLASQLLEAGPLLLAATSILLAVLVSGIHAAWVEG